MALTWIRRTRRALPGKQPHEANERSHIVDLSLATAHRREVLPFGKYHLIEIFLRTSIDAQGAAHVPTIPLDPGSRGLGDNHR